MCVHHHILTLISFIFLQCWNCVRVNFLLYPHSHAAEKKLCRLQISMFIILKDSVQKMGLILVRTCDTSRQKSEGQHQISAIDFATCELSLMINSLTTSIISTNNTVNHKHYISSYRCSYLLHGKLPIWMWCCKRRGPMSLSISWVAVRNRWQNMCG